MLRRRFSIAFLAALTLVVASYGRVAPTSPDVGLDNAAASSHMSTQTTTIGVTTDDNGPAPAVATPVLQPVQVLVQPVTSLVNGLLRLVTSIVRLVLPGVETNVSTARWSLQFHSGSLTTSKLISIKQSTDGLLRADFGPEGTQFGTPVDVTISYAGTTLDPSMRGYVRGVTPVFLWLDPSTGKWVVLPSTNDPATRTLHAQLHHFSSYAVGGRAGW